MKARARRGGDGQTAPVAAVRGNAVQRERSGAGGQVESGVDHRKRGDERGSTQQSNTDATSSLRLKITVSC